MPLRIWLLSGGSLVPGFGGHNPLEAAAYGVCPVMGPHCENVDDIVQQLVDSRGCLRIRTGEEAAALIARLCARDPELKAAGARAREVWRANLGATERILRVLTEGLRAEAEAGAAG